MYLCKDFCYLLFVLLVSYLKIHCQIQGHEDNLIVHDYLMFSSNHFIVVALTFSSLIHFELIFVYIVR